MYLFVFHLYFRPDPLHVDPMFDTLVMNRITYSPRYRTCIDNYTSKKGQRHRGFLQPNKIEKKKHVFGLHLTRLVESPLP